MRPCKCRHCQTNTNTDDAYLVMLGKQRAYFCNEEHYNLFIEEKEAIKQKKTEEKEATRQKKKEEHDATVQKHKEIKNNVYYLICDIIGRKEILNTILWKEWKEWNKVFSNETIASYLEENKAYLTSTISRLEDKEFNRIRYLSAILKNSLEDFKPKEKETEKPKVKVDESFYESIPTTQNKRRSLADLEDEF